MASASADAHVADIIKVLKSRNAAAMLSETHHIKLLDVAHVCRFILDVDSPIVTIRKNISEWLDCNADDCCANGEVLMYDRTQKSVHATYLATVLLNVCHVNLTDAHLETIITAVLPSRAPNLRRVLTNIELPPLAAAGSAASSSDVVSVVLPDVPELDEYGQQELKHMVLAKTIQLDELNQELSLCRKREAHYKEQCEARANEIVSLRDTLTNMHAMVNYRGGLGKHNVSAYGGYNLALRRCKGHTGAATTVAMLASDDVNGSLSAKDVVYVFEHRAAEAKRLRAKDAYYEMAHNDSGDTFSYIAHCYLGDATHDSVIDKKKVYVAVLGTTWCTSAEVDAALDDRGYLQADQLECKQTKNACTLQVVAAGTGQETYAIARHNFESVGCTTWEALNPRSGAVSFNFGFDQGQDCKGTIARVAFRLENSVNVAYCVVWCYFHIANLIVYTHLQTMDSLKWPEASGGEWPTKYFSGVATISNTWRSALSNRYNQLSHQPGATYALGL